MEKGTLSPLTKTRCASNDFTTIPLVSTEKWEQIFSKLNQQEVAQARLVCPYWKTIIDNNYKFYIKIEEHSFEELPIPFKVKVCFLYKLKKDIKKIFKYPDLVESLNLSGKLNSSTLRNIFAETTNLKKLNFNTIFDPDGKEIYMPEESICFKNLLELSVLHNRGYYAIGDALSINAKRLFFYEMPLLKKLYVSIYERWNELESIFLSFFRFLAKHSKTIKLFRASFIPYFTHGSHSVPPSIQQMFNEEEAQNIIQKLNDPKFQVTTLILALPTIYSSLWESIIEHQNKLITFYIECIEDEIPFTISRVPFTTIQSTLDRNACTLVTLHLAGLTLEENQNREVDPRLFIPIDGLVFRDLNKLRRLILKKIKEYYSYHDEIQSDAATITNIHEIPSDLLEVLEITRFVCETSELETLVEKSPRLKIVILHETGVTNGKGVTVGILDNLTKKKDIHIIDFFPLKEPDNDEESKKLLELEQQNPQVVRTHGHHYYFNFDRLKRGIEQEPYRRYKHPFDLK